MNAKEIVLPMQDWVEEFSKEYNLLGRQSFYDKYSDEPSVCVYKIKNYKIDKKSCFMFNNICYLDNSFEVIRQIYEKFGPGFYYAELNVVTRPGIRTTKTKIFELMNDAKAPNLSYERQIEE
jgi:hypothetical protein